MKKTKMAFNPSYVGKRNDVLALVPNNVKRVLEIGCSIGVLGEQIKQRNKGIEVIGIEVDKQMAKIAKRKLDKVIIKDIEIINLIDYFSPNYFDCIIFADVLEHLRNPWDVLKNATSILNDKGIIIVSIPNIGHYTVIINLLKGYWPYRERGLHDKTHLRFFTLRNIKELFEYADLRIIRLERNYRIMEKNHHSNWNRFSKYFRFLPIFKELFVFQYVAITKLKRLK